MKDRPYDNEPIADPHDDPDLICVGCTIRKVLNILAVITACIGLVAASLVSIAVDFHRMAGSFEETR
jgi:hypothetical protein